MQNGFNNGIMTNGCGNGAASNGCGCGCGNGNGGGFINCFPHNQCFCPQICCVPGPMGPAGTPGISRYFGSFFSTAAQALTAGNNIAFNTSTNLFDGVTLNAAGTVATVAVGGIYNITYGVQPIGLVPPAVTQIFVNGAPLAGTNVAPDTINNMYTVSTIAVIPDGAEIELRVVSGSITLAAGTTNAFLNIFFLRPTVIPCEAVVV